MKKRKVVAPATVAALVAGVTGPDASVTPEKPDAVPVVGEEAAVETDVEIVNEASEEMVEGSEASTPSQTEAVDLAVLREALTTAKAELKDTQREQFKAEAKIEQLEEALSASKEEVSAAQHTIGKLAAIVGDVMNNMNVALGRGRQDVSGLSGEEVVSRYAAVKEEFSQAYLAGGVTGAVDNESDTNKKPFRDSTQQAVIDSVGL